MLLLIKKKKLNILTFFIKLKNKDYLNFEKKK